MSSCRLCVVVRTSCVGSESAHQHMRQCTGRAAELAHVHCISAMAFLTLLPRGARQRRRSRSRPRRKSCLACCASSWARPSGCGTTWCCSAACRRAALPCIPIVVSRVFARARDPAAYASRHTSASTGCTCPLLFGPSGCGCSHAASETGRCARKRKLHLAAQAPLDFVRRDRQRAWVAR